MRKLVLLITHIAALAIGFAGGIYALPILIAPSGPATADIAAQAAGARYKGQFRRDLQDSDALHWGEGTVSVSAQVIGFEGKLTPGPDYKIYLSPEFVETESEFNRLKPGMSRIGDVKTFESFLVQVPPGVDVARFNTVIIWCETFGQFITAAKYR